MRKVLTIWVLGLLWCNVGFAKIINIENKITLDIPNNHKFIKFEEDGSMGDVDLSEIFEAFEVFEADIYMTGPNKLIDLYQSMIDGEDPMNNKDIRAFVKKIERKARSAKSESQLQKTIIAESKKFLKKEKINFENYVIISRKKFSEIIPSDLEFDEFDISEFEKMTNAELKQVTKEVRKEITKEAGDNKTILAGPSKIVIKKFKLAKNEYNELFFTGEGKVSFAINDDMFVTNLSYILFSIVKNDRAYLILSECIVNCSKHSKKFQKMIEPAFSEKISLEKTVSTQEISTGIVDQLKQLKQLYDEGVLTKEEFEKAKKKLLN